MKKVLLATAILMTSIASHAETKEQNTSTKNKVYYSLFWGLIKSKNYPQKNVEGDLVKKHKSSIFIYKKPNDPKNYEVINWLGGAIQFSGKVKKIE
jgi:hypothetical protein